MDPKALRVAKESGKPFKSGLKINTVKGVIEHPKLGIPAFVFVEDQSYVECRQCVPIEGVEDEPIHAE